MLAFRSVAFLVALLLANSANAKCLSYADRIQLTGTIQELAFPGPPNYENISTGDKAEKSWYLNLKTSVCVDKKIDDDTGYDAAVVSISRIQLVLTYDQYRDYRYLIGRSVTIKVNGTLFGAHTGHYHTAVLLHDVEFQQ